MKKCIIIPKDATPTVDEIASMAVLHSAQYTDMDNEAEGNRDCIQVDEEPIDVSFEELQKIITELVEERSKLRTNLS